MLLIQPFLLSCFLVVLALDPQNFPGHCFNTPNCYKKAKKILSPEISEKTSFYA